VFLEGAYGIDDFFSPFISTSPLTGELFCLAACLDLIAGSSDDLP
jgi:hypothetical protein